LVGGGNAIGVRLTVAELSPFWGATLRFGAAGLVLVAIVIATRREFPRGRRLIGAALFGTFGFGLAYTFIYWSLRSVPAGTAQIVLSVVPLVTLLLAVVQDVERFRLRGLVGATIAGAGIVVVFLDQASLDVPIPLLIALIAAAVCIGEGNVLVKRFPPGEPVAANAVAMLCGASVLGALTILSGAPVVLPARTETWLAVGYLVVFGSIVLFVLTLFVLERWTASAASYAFLLVPLVTVALAAVLLRERVGPDFLVGAGLVLVGVYVGAFSGSSVLRRPNQPARVASDAAASPGGVRVDPDGMG